ncbi:MAG: hypothetical protein SFU56_19515 [Capsulimonadales bacterium]|nr:hypothetical protein [Capsulimonadales bacterium]
MINKKTAGLLAAVLLGSAVLAAIPVAKQIARQAKARRTKKVYPVKLGQPIEAIALDTVLENGHMSIISNNGQFAEIKFQPFTRVRFEGFIVSPDQIPDRERMIVWGKWDKDQPNVFKALAVSCRQRLSEVTVRQKIAVACQNVTQGRTVASAARTTESLPIVRPTRSADDVAPTAPQTAAAAPETAPSAPNGVLPVTLPAAPVAGNSVPVIGPAAGSAPQTSAEF